MPEEPIRKRRLRAPSLRRFVASALASFVAVFGVLALRLHDGQDPSLRGVATVNPTNTTASQAGDDTASDDSATSSDDSSGAVSSTPSVGTSAS